MKIEENFYEAPCMVFYSVSFGALLNASISAENANWDWDNDNFYGEESN